VKAANTIEIGLDMGNMKNIILEDLDKV